LAQAMTEAYIAASRDEGVALDPAHFRLTAAVLAAQRNAKIIGIFARCTSATTNRAISPTAEGLALYGGRPSTSRAGKAEIMV